jgi:hypothetical protein
MQAGACTTALVGAREGFLSCDFIPKQGDFAQDKTAHPFFNEATESSAENTTLDLPKKGDFHEAKPPRKRMKGTGDTDTTGKHNKRFKAYCKAVKEGKINPSQYALTRHEIDGKKIGSVTAVEFLQAMEGLGIVQRTEKGGKTTYILA